MTATSFAALFGTMLAIAAVPGPSDFLVVGRSMAHGFAHGALVALGVVAADYLFIFAAIYSLGWIADQLGTLFQIVKFACGSYLIYLGVSALRERATRPSLAGDAAASGYSSLSSGFLITLGDPKAILFYVGLLPAFVDPAAATGRDVVTIMIVATATIAAIKLTYAALADWARTWLENSRARSGLTITAGAALIGTGLWLLWHG